MTLRGSWFETAEPAEIIRRASDAGAKFHYTETMFTWLLLDMDDSPLWWARFNSKADAARAFLYWLERKN